MVNSCEYTGQGESKVGIHPVKYLMDKDRAMKLRTPFKEIKVNF